MKSRAPTADASGATWATSLSQTSGVARKSTGTRSGSSCRSDVRTRSREFMCPLSLSLDCRRIAPSLLPSSRAARPTLAHRREDNESEVVTLTNEEYEQHRLLVMIE